MLIKDRPIRMRGFHRAVKRKEGWALKIWNLRETRPLGYLLALYYRNIDFGAELLKPSLFDIIPGRDDMWGGTTIHIPFNFPDESSQNE